MICLILLTIYFGSGFSLECTRAWPPNCQYNSTCIFSKKVCNNSSSISPSRGGTYCATLIEKDDHNKIAQMDCMYDQEISKPCKNQSSCIMIYTSTQLSYLHCCCDQHFCNLNFTIPSDPIYETTTTRTTITKGRSLCNSKKWLCILLLTLFICLFVFILIVSIIYRQKILRSFEECLRHLIKNNKKQILIPNPEEEPMINKDFIQFNQITIVNDSIKKGRFSIIHQGLYQNKSVAIKMLISNNLNDQLRKLFENEKEIYSTLANKHQNILQYYGYSEWNEKLLLISEFSENGSLRDVLRSRLLKDETELIFILKQISDGIKYLHSEENSNGTSRPSIAHRDLKTANILYINSNKLVLCDFAMSTKIEGNNHQPNQQQQIGTARYMSPELLAGTIGSERDALLKCDVYALGIVFWEVLSRYPFKGLNEKYAEPFEEELLLNNCNITSPTINDMLKIMSLGSPRNRPFVNPLWKSSTNICFDSILNIIEDCWISSPESRISAATVYLRINKIS